MSIILQDLLHMISMLSIATTGPHCLLEWSNMILLCFASPDPLETPARFEVAELCSLVKGKPTTSRILLTPQQGLMSHFSKGGVSLEKAFLLLASLQLHTTSTKIRAQIAPHLEKKNSQ